MKTNHNKIIIPDGASPLPELHEIKVAKILAGHFRTDIEFLTPNLGYKMRTPDISMLNREWEIKSPTGASRYTIKEQFRGLRQSRNLVIDGTRTRLLDAKIIEQIKFEITKHHRVGQVIFITKTGDVVVIKQ